MNRGAFGTKKFQNQLERAEAGDIDAQMFVAQEYYSSDDYHITQDYYEAQKWLMEILRYSSDRLETRQEAQNLLETLT